jgi:DNA-binding CsgD family transcriptional regulator
VIEPATASEIAPIITEAYELSAREREITQLIARGLGTAQIAAGLHLSTHTVRDYVKTVFDKVGVSSRGELVAKLFAEHYAPLHFDPSGLDQVEHGASPALLR